MMKMIKLDIATLEKALPRPVTEGSNVIGHGFAGSRSFLSR